jgi:hypothetical protein
MATYTSKRYSKRLGRKDNNVFWVIVALLILAALAYGAGTYYSREQLLPVDVTETDPTPMPGAPRD